MTKLTLRLFIPIIIIGSLLLIVSPVLAQDIFDYTGAGTFGELIRSITTYVLSLVGPIAVLISLWAAFLLMTAAGDPKKVTAGHLTLTWAVIGLAVVILSKAALSITQTTIGAGGPQDIIDKLIGYLLTIGGPIAIVMFLYGSFLITTGQPKKIQTAYKIFLWTSVAIVIIVISSSIQTFVLSFLNK